MRSRYGELPLKGGWERPAADDQRTRFKQQTDNALAELRVSRDEIRRWHQLGWISFEVDALAELDEPEKSEIAFVCSIARSGLSEAQVSVFLGELSKPYKYAPDRVAYHFVFGWV